ncbi:hypothetical protein ACHH1T_25740 [Citrobacter freundii complex sp. 2024EL-00238]|uniref:hypothetical protein n=1 Tax=Citrobacter freundii complex TaxID=1344959 RepID=UPI0018A94CE1|nr:hypothetical protein [Citrobacter freundii]ELP1413157.1 hypothetical protein [Citrobacter freundii]HAU5661416.1 hypothetical protein [Citrobacter freundii]HBV0977977.1 hypothetical protein [Citrobacter freundii]HCB2472257.1 hypothetical protein [Citrobacter freundii]HDQ2968333.1 hypothetical protein [Citrobacter freundii]
MKGILIIRLVMFALAIPTSVFGLQLMGTKVVGQQLGCIVDNTNAEMTWFSDVELGNVNPTQGLEKMSTDLSTCVKDIDPRKGTIKFAMEQYQRYH